MRSKPCNGSALKRISPSRYGSMFMTALPRVDFPEPFNPIILTVSPLTSSRLTSCKILIKGTYPPDKFLISNMYFIILNNYSLHPCHQVHLRSCRLFLSSRYQGKRKSRQYPGQSACCVLSSRLSGHFPSPSCG